MLTFENAPWGGVERPQGSFPEHEIVPSVLTPQTYQSPGKSAENAPGGGATEEPQHAAVPSLLIAQVDQLLATT